MVRGKKNVLGEKNVLGDGVNIRVRNSLKTENLTFQGEGNLVGGSDW